MAPERANQEYVSGGIDSDQTNSTSAVFPVRRCLIPTACRIVYNLSGWRMYNTHVCGFFHR